MKVNFTRKPTPSEIYPQDEFIIEKVVRLSEREFAELLREPMKDRDYIRENKELMYEDSDDFNLYYIPSDALEFPHTWDDDVFMVECVNPPHCNRCIRPIQCRTFPLIPHLSRDDTFHLILDRSEFPYCCPIVDENMKLNADFIKVTFKVWKILIEDPIVYDLIKYDSSLRDDRKSNYNIVI